MAQLNEIKRMQQLAGLLKENLEQDFNPDELEWEEDEKNGDLLSFIRQNQAEAAEQVGAIRLEDIMIDDFFNGVKASAIFDDDDGEIRDEVSFRYSEDVDGNFEGENGSEPRPIEVAGKELMYISYNI
jgi:hypothetical protein